ncbi:MAG: HlyD family efflux transporter periplasmic adaptor subunit, partial [Microcystaceae cyanobacterium]
MIPTNTVTTEPIAEETKPPSSKPPQGKIWLWIMFFLLMGTGAIAFNWFQGKKPDPAASGKMAGPPPSPVKWEVAQQVPVKNSLALVGTLEAKGGVDLTSEVDGRITRILIKEGDRVQQGSEVMRLDTDTLKVELMSAQATLAKDLAALNKLKAGSRKEDVAEAQAMVKQASSQLLNAKSGASPEEIAQAVAQINAAKAVAQLAEARVKRYQALRDEGVIPLDTFDQQVKERRQAIADVDAAQRRLAQLQKARTSEIERITSAVEEKRQNLDRLQNGSRPEDVAQAQAQVAESLAKVQAVKVKLEKSQVKAPFTGIVGYIPAKVGNYVQAGDKLTTLTANNNLEINLPVPLSQAAQLRLGLPVEILDAEDKAIASGAISFISPNVDSNAQSILARASFSNAGTDLLNRQLVQAR